MVIKVLRPVVVHDICMAVQSDSTSVCKSCWKPSARTQRGRPTATSGRCAGQTALQTQSNGGNMRELWLAGRSALSPSTGASLRG